MTDTHLPPHKRIVTAGYFGLCDNCGHDIEGIPSVTYWQVNLPYRGHRKYYSYVCMKAAEDPDSTDYTRDPTNQPENIR